MTRNGGRDESTTQVISTRGQEGWRRSGAHQADEGSAQGSAQESVSTAAQPVYGADRREAAPVLPPDAGRAGRVEQRGERGRVRRARLRAVRLDPWSVMKTSFLLSIAAGVILLVAVAVIWKVLETAGVYDAVNRTVADVLGGASNAHFDINEYVGLQRVLGITTLLCVVDVVLITAIATLGAFLYNLSAALLGGVEVTLAEDE